MLTICIILIVLLALDLLFTLALRCRKGHKKWQILKKYRYAHRGFHDKPQIPENSLPAFRRAIEHGCGAVLDGHLLKDGTLAGSTLTMVRAFQNLMRFGATPEEAALMTTQTPAQSIGNEELGEIELGAPAIFSRFDENYAFKGTVG